jgi:tetratricopeptide (TPR) repeat protein
LAAETLEELNEMGVLVSENKIGILYAESGNSEKAQKWYRKAIEKSPNNPWPMSNLALELTQVGDNDEALKWFRRSLENDSANYYTLYNMALVEQEEGYGDEAKKHFKQAFTLLRRKCLDDDMTDIDWTWMEGVANNAGKEDEGKELMKRRKLRKKDKGYNDGNLAVSAIKNNKEV